MLPLIQSHDKTWWYVHKASPGTELFNSGVPWGLTHELAKCEILGSGDKCSHQKFWNSVNSVNMASTWGLCKVDLLNAELCNSETVMLEWKGRYAF